VPQSVSHNHCGSIPARGSFEALILLGTLTMVLPFDVFSFCEIKLNEIETSLLQSEPSMKDTVD
jgi:hypothetical protein